jgi:transcription initiation factor TFIID subunit 10
MEANPPTANAAQATAPAVQPNGAQPSETAGANADATAVPPAPETRLPTRKDASLKEFLNKMDDYAPIVRAVTISKRPSSTVC